MASYSRKKIRRANNIRSHTYFYYLNWGKTLATGIYSYVNMNKHLGYGAEQMLKEDLFENTNTCFYKHDTWGWIVCNFLTGPENYYNAPTWYEIYTKGGLFRKRVTQEDIIVIRNTNVGYLGRPSPSQRQNISLWADRMTDLQITMDINIEQQRTTTIVQTSKDTLQTVLNVLEQNEIGVAKVIAQKDFDLQDMFKVLDGSSPYNVDRMMRYKHDLMNELLTYLGICNANTDKTQSMTEAEIGSNDELVTFFLYSTYLPRKEAIDELNERMGLQGEDRIQLKINRDVYELMGEVYNLVNVPDTQDTRDRLEDEE